MTTLALGVVGAAAGFALGGPFGASIGWSAGVLAGNYLFPGPGVQGPRLTDLRLQGSAYGAFEPIIYGRVRVAPNVIWQTDLQPHPHTSGGKGGGGPKTTTFSYSASFDSAFCEGGEGYTLWKLWAWGRLIYDTHGGLVGTGDVPITFYDGREDQQPDPTEEADTGVGLTPAYRGLARAVFNNWDLTQFGNQIPGLEALISSVPIETGPIHLVKTRTMDPEWTDATRVTAWATDLDKDTELALPETADPIELVYIEYAGGTRSARYQQINSLHLEDGTDVALWVCPDFATSTGLGNPSVSTVAPYNNGASVGGSNFAYSVGIPAGCFVKASVSTADRKTLILFTNTVDTPESGKFDHWYKIRGGTIDDIHVITDGTVDPNVSFTGIGYANFCVAPAGFIASSTFAASMLEKGERYIWTYYGSGGPLGSIHLHKFEDDGNLVFDSVGGQPTESATGYRPSVYSMVDGFCGSINGNKTSLWTRLVDDDPTVPLSEIVADQCVRAGLTSGQYDVSQLTDRVSGYMISNQMAGRAAIEALMPVYFFDAVESDGKIKFIKRGNGTVFTIPDDDLAAHADGIELPAKLERVRTQEQDLPAFISLVYPNKNGDYLLGTQTSQRMVTSSELTTTVQTTVVLTDSQAKQIVDAWLFDAWLRRDAYTFYTSYKYAKYEPTDIAVVGGRRLFVTAKTLNADGVTIKWSAAPIYDPVFAQAGVAGDSSGGSGTPPSIEEQQGTELKLLDIPYIADPARQSIYWAAMAGADRRSWVGASLQKSIDGGTSYAELAQGETPDTIGETLSVLGNWTGGNVFDEMNSVTVYLHAGAGTLESFARAGVLNGAGEYLIGDEVLRAKNAVLIAERTYLLSGLLRGRRGTGWAMGAHVVGERVIELPAQLELPAIYAEYGATRLYKAVTLGRALSTAGQVPFVNTGRALKCYAPVHLRGGRDASGNITLKCRRRARVNGAWLNGVDVPLGEAEEKYVFHLYDGSGYGNQLAHYITLVPIQVVSAADQSAVFGGLEAPLYWGVQQYGALGPGYEARGIT